MDRPMRTSVVDSTKVEKLGVRTHAQTGNERPYTRRKNPTSQRQYPSSHANPLRTTHTQTGRTVHPGSTPRSAPSGETRPRRPWTGRSSPPLPHLPHRPPLQLQLLDRLAAPFPCVRCRLSPRARRPGRRGVVPKAGRSRRRRPTRADPPLETTRRTTPHQCGR